MMDYNLEALRKLINVYFESEDYPSENGWQCVLCADIIVYFDGWTDTLQVNEPGIQDFYTRAMELVAKDVRWVLVNGEGHFRKANKKMFDMVPFWISPDGPVDGTVGVNMQGGPEKNGRTDSGFELHRSIASHLRLTLPVEYMLEDPVRFAQLAEAMVKRLRFVSGSAGFSLNLIPEQWQQFEGEHIHMLTRRFVGLDIGVPWDWSKYAIEGLKTVNWLTFIGDGLAQRMGGRAGVRSALPADAPVTELEHGLMIQAGPRPLLGDVNRPEDITAYRKIAQALKPLSIPSSMIRPGLFWLGGHENTLWWLSRFHEER